MAEHQDNRTRLRIFIENHAENFGLTVYHISLLKVIAEYCDMTLGYCCLAFHNLCKFSRMSDPQRRKITAFLIKKKLITQTYVNAIPIHRLGEIINNNSINSV